MEIVTVQLCIKTNCHHSFFLFLLKFDKKISYGYYLASKNYLALNDICILLESYSDKQIVRSFTKTWFKQTRTKNILNTRICFALTSKELVTIIKKCSVLLLKLINSYKSGNNIQKQ